MMNSGPGGTWRKGRWAEPKDPVIGWRVWFWRDGMMWAVYGNKTWRGGENGVLAACLYTDRGPDKPIGRTFMMNVDEYPPPPGVGGQSLIGVQVGDVNGNEWAEIVNQIRNDPWRPTRG